MDFQADLIDFDVGDCIWMLEEGQSKHRHFELRRSANQKRRHGLTINSFVSSESEATPQYAWVKSIAGYLPLVIQVTRLFLFIDPNPIMDSLGLSVVDLSQENMFES